jgi:glycogen debranching enzyme
VGDERCLPKCRCEAFGTLPVPLAERAAAWRRGFPELRSGWDDLDHLYRRSLDDLTALLMEDPDGRGDLVVAAGLPWFMTLFGRDAILTALMAVPFDREVPAGVLRTLARHQGTVRDERSEEAPGKILHEIRAGRVALRGGTARYYGTVDATPLFVTLVAEARRWGLPPEEVAALLPNVRRALGWMRTDGDPDGDGYLEYPGRTDRGLRNQGWKDSWDAIRFADGRLAEGPIALAEVQGYKHRALLDAAELLERSGEEAEAAAARREAGELAERFRRDFWLEEVGFPALALDGEKRPVDAVASNAGHLLWTGILAPEQEAAVARRIASPELSSGWGLRTLSASSGGYNPVSYHVGSVWPHDTAIAVAGLARAGFREEALALARGLIDASAHFSYRLPELFAGFSRARFGFPVRYPTASSPQAWAAASVLLLLRALLGLEPEGEGRPAVRPILPPQALPLSLEGLRFRDELLSLYVGADGSVTVTGVPEERTERGSDRR